MVARRGARGDGVVTGLEEWASDPVAWESRWLRIYLRERRAWSHGSYGDRGEVR